jgi:hypothetical protein
MPAVGPAAFVGQGRACTSGRGRAFRAFSVWIRRLGLLDSPPGFKVVTTVLLMANRRGTLFNALYDEVRSPPPPPPPPPPPSRPIPSHPRGRPYSRLEYTHGLRGVARTRTYLPVRTLSGIARSCSSTC